MGAGKSTIGRLLAKELRLSFKDSDKEIEQRTGADIPWIFDVEGEQGWRSAAFDLSQFSTTGTENGYIRPFIYAEAENTSIQIDNIKIYDAVKLEAHQKTEFTITIDGADLKFPYSHISFTSTDFSNQGQKEMYSTFESTFMMYLPRLCEHCLDRKSVV